MDIVTTDFETYWAQGYTLSSMTTEAYVRDPRFEAILCSFQINNERPWWVPRDMIPAALKDLRLDRRAVLMHHAHFDAFILNHHYDVRPKIILDTLSMGRALHGSNAGLSLAKLAERYGIGTKGHEVMNARGMRFDDFAPWQLEKYGAYGCNDCTLTQVLGSRMMPQFQQEELQIMDQVIRMFTEPVFDLDAELLEKYRQQLAAEKLTLMLRAGVQKEDLMSNEKFAALLMDRGIDPPRKISPTTGKETWAFAKTDKGMQELQEHDDPEVQVLVEARLKNKTTIAEKGAERLIGMAGRGKATVYLKVSGASGTHRLSGGDLFNWQSMKRGSDLRKSVKAPPGHKCVVVDSSTIEARILDWLAGQDDMVEVYRKQDNKTGPDMYCTIAEKIYGRPINKADDPDERQMGKVAKLGLGFGMGDQKFVISVRGQATTPVLDFEGNLVIDPETGKPKRKPLVLSKEFGKFVVDVYRNTHPQVKKLWARGESALKAIANGQIGVNVDFRGIVKTCKDGLVMPNGLKILYPDLRKVKNEDPDSPFKEEWEFWNGRNRERIYGAKVIENIIQCLARCVVFSQCLQVVKRTAAEAGTRWAHSVHDEGVFVVPDFYAPWVLDVAIECFREPPSWAPDLPVNCEGGLHQRYGLAKS